MLSLGDFIKRITVISPSVAIAISNGYALFIVAITGKFSHFLPLFHGYSFLPQYFGNAVITWRTLPQASSS